MRRRRRLLCFFTRKYTYIYIHKYIFRERERELEEIIILNA